MGYFKKKIQKNVKIKNVTLQSLRRDLENLKVNENESVQNYYTKITKIVNEMETSGEQINVAIGRIVEKIIVNLPQKYYRIVLIIE